jgi:hypothetical protein
MGNMLFSRPIHAPNSVIITNSNNVGALLLSSATSVKTTRNPDIPKRKLMQLQHQKKARATN